MSPLIRIRLAQLLARKYHLDSEQAVNLAEDLARLCQSGNLDIVLGSWVHGSDVVQPKRDFWEGVADNIEHIDEHYGDWHPWRPE